MNDIANAQNNMGAKLEYFNSLHPKLEAFIILYNHQE
jgi:hypothetical protein